MNFNHGTLINNNLFYPKKFFSNGLVYPVSETFKKCAP